MTTLLYDGSFEGLMTAVFEVFEYRFEPVEIVSAEHYAEDMFSEFHKAISDSEKADRVIKKLENN